MSFCTSRKSSPSVNRLLWLPLTCGGDGHPFVGHRPKCGLVLKLRRSVIATSISAGKNPWWFFAIGNEGGGLVCVWTNGKMGFSLIASSYRSRKPGFPFIQQCCQRNSISLKIPAFLQTGPSFLFQNLAWLYIESSSGEAFPKLTFATNCLM